MYQLDSINSKNRVYNIYRASSRLNNEDIIKLISHLSSKYLLNHINYSYMDYSDDRDNNNFSLVKITKLNELIQALEKYPIVDVTAVYSTNGKMDDRNTICILLKPRSDKISIVYEFVSEKNNYIVNEFEDTCRRHL